MGTCPRNMSVSSKATWGGKRAPSYSERSVTLEFYVSDGVERPGENHIKKATIKPPTLAQLYWTLQQFGYNVRKIKLDYPWMKRLPYFKDLRKYDLLQDFSHPRMRHVGIHKFDDDYVEKKTVNCVICKNPFVNVKRPTRTRYQAAAEDDRYEKTNICYSCFLKSRNLIYEKLRAKPETILHYRSKFEEMAKEVQWLKRK